MKERISRSKAVELIQNSKGRFFTVTFKKKNGERRMLNGNVNSKRFQNKLGYILFNSSKKGMKSINPRTIESLNIEKVEYVIK